MIRFPNPGSDISALVRTFQALFEILSTFSSFTLDNISSALVTKNLATSSGHIGQEALRRSTRANRTLDPLFNQSKMYSELFRILGWIHPYSSGRQEFVFSFLGIHIGMAKYEPTDLLKECLFGITYPNPLVKIKGANFARPLPLIISTAAALDSRITRDEIILGPLDIDDDRSEESLEEMHNRLRYLRDNPLAVEDTLKEKASQLGIQVNTLHNYTRFPLGVLRWAGWANPQRNNGLFHVLTHEGIRVSGWINTLYDIRSKDLQDFSSGEVDSFLKLATFRMFERAHYSIPYGELEICTEGCLRILTSLNLDNTEQILFSPFQEYDPRRVQQLFQIPKGTSVATVSEANSTEYTTKSYQQETRGYVRMKSADQEVLHSKFQSDIINRVQHYAESEQLSLDGVIQSVVSEYNNSSKDKFYPAVEALLYYLGYQCELSRIGVNYQRMDALIKHETQSIPIEIKSPGEEEYISVKGVRQALENKIVLLSRQYAPSLWETTSLVVGFELPADRSEVSQLVDDIYKAFGISVGVIDFRSLVRLAAMRYIQDKKPNEEDIFKLRGLIEISDSKV
ncbi:hypothetical protein ES707_16948 [subsurface metagenome]